MAYKKIADYAVIGSGHTVALIGKDGSVDWLCLPYLDSPSVFAALLDDERGGRFLIRPRAAWDSVQSYLPQTNILKTIFRTAEGEVEMLDFMPAGPDVERDLANGGRLIRRVTGIRGEVELVVECAPRFNYARAIPRWSGNAGEWIAAAGEERLSLTCTDRLAWNEESATLDVHEGDTIWLALSYGPDSRSLDDSELDRLFQRTRDYWIAWTRSAETGRLPPDGFWRQELDRSALVLKLLQMESTGAIAAAPTTSLPAIIHGERNWDYRYNWVRDTSLIISALFELGHLDEGARYLAWLKTISSKDSSGRLGVVYQLRECEPPQDETILDHLCGYKNSAPVRIGQFAVNQHQHDIYGQLLDTVFAASRYVGKVDVSHWGCVRRIVDHVVAIWKDRDDGIWEARIGKRHYTHSKLMCWVALDRAIKVAEHYGFPGDLPRWTAEWEALRRDILERGYNENRGAFTQHYDTEDVDAALLLIPLIGFLPITDPRVEATIKTIENELLHDGVLLRYTADDGLEGREGGFLICLFWYLHCLILQKRLDEVEDYLREIGHCANHVGLFGEQFDPRFGEITGNFPQAYSHISYATVVLQYLDAKTSMPEPRPIGVQEKIKLLIRARRLNSCPDEPLGEVADNPAEEMKRSMNILRGQFYDGHQQRIEYTRIRDSGYYDTFKQAAAQLCAFDPASLATDAERISFWINVFNTFVIHGVIELGVRETVKEVPFFFNCIEYRIGSEVFTPQDIEHGILRGNAYPPYRLWRQFRPGDARARYAVARTDPRIHFALVCASRTCPPIEVYEADRLDEQLTTSAQVFVNGTTHYDRGKKALWISEIFKWYRQDFGRSGPALIDYLADYLYDEVLADEIRKHARGIELRYTPYDWRLNR